MPEQMDADPVSHNINPGVPANGQAAPDLEELARKVVELLLREIKLENERSGKF